MSEPNDGGPAFPVLRMPLDPDAMLNHPGMSQRAWFAGQALAGWAGNCRGMFFVETETLVASNCVRYADAMLAELTKQPEAKP